MVCRMIDAWSHSCSLIKMHNYPAEGLVLVFILNCLNDLFWVYILCMLYSFLKVHPLKTLYCLEDQICTSLLLWGGVVFIRRVSVAYFYVLLYKYFGEMFILPSWKMPRWQTGIKESNTRISHGLSHETPTLVGYLIERITKGRNCRFGQEDHSTTHWIYSTFEK